LLLISLSNLTIISVFELFQWFKRARSVLPIVKQNQILKYKNLLKAKTINKDLFTYAFHLPEIFLSTDARSALRELHVRSKQEFLRTGIKEQSSKSVCVPKGHATPDILQTPTTPKRAYALLFFQFSLSFSLSTSRHH
jgi:hypothetical protein